MNNLTVIDSVKRQNKIIHYGLWIISTVIISLAISFFIKLLNNHVLQPIPDGYRFSVVDHSTTNTADWKTYYIYDNQIIVYKEFPDESSSSSPAVIYDNLDTTDLVLNEEDLAKSCDSGGCYQYPKVLNEIKKLIAGKVSREFLRL